MSENKNNSTEVAVTSGFAALAGLDILQEALADDCQGLDFTFDRIKIPAGGSTAFEVPGDDDEDTTMAKEITGVILFNHPAYAYYTEKYAGGSNPPDCGSFDGVTGTGNPGGTCANCHYNQFGSGEGQSKACKNRRLIYILQEGELFPMVLSLPTGSLKKFTKYVKRQLSKGRKLNQVVTKISLKKATSSTGIAFSQAVFSFVRVLDDAEKTAMATMTEQVKSYAANLTTAALAEVTQDESMVDPETGEIIEPLSE